MKICTSDISTRFLAGLLTVAESATFEDHIENCPHCREQLEREAGNDEAWKSARELLMHPMPATTNWVSSAEVIADRSSSDSDWLPACTSSVVLSILAPSDDPQFVGRIGTYEISGIVGRGSAGIVLRGFDPALHRNVAIKILDPALAGVGAARQRFGREARAMAAISHEHVVPVYEVSEHAGLPYFVMEYVSGGSLERRLRTQGPFDVQAVIRIGLQTAQALAAAHANGLVHRDIKPGNVLLDRGTERIRVADFGLVRVANDVSCTRSGFIAGTPQYMAPEQMKAEICDGRSDLFSLGSLMYALCTGHAPFRADSVYAVMQRIVHDSPRSIREYNVLVPEWLEDFILKLMSKDRDDRFVSADEVFRNLQMELAILQSAGEEPARYWQAARQRQSVPAPGSGYFARLRLGFVATALLGMGAIIWYGVVTQSWFETGSSPQNLVSDASPFIEPVPIDSSWDDDGFEAVRNAFGQLDEDFHRPSLSLPPDLWDQHLLEFHQRLTEVSDELVEAFRTDPQSSQLPFDSHERK